MYDKQNGSLSWAALQFEFTKNTKNTVYWMYYKSRLYSLIVRSFSSIIALLVLKSIIGSSVHISIH